MSDAKLLELVVCTWQWWLNLHEPVASLKCQDAVGLTSCRLQTSDLVNLITTPPCSWPSML